jgi:hypothetical protein
MPGYRGLSAFHFYERHARRFFRINDKTRVWAGELTCVTPWARFTPPGDEENCVERISVVTDKMSDTGINMGGLLIETGHGPNGVKSHHPRKSF